MFLEPLSFKKQSKQVIWLKYFKFEGLRPQVWYTLKRLEQVMLL